MNDWKLGMPRLLSVSDRSRKWSSRTGGAGVIRDVPVIQQIGRVAAWLAVEIDGRSVACAQEGCRKGEGCSSGYHNERFDD